MLNAGLRELRLIHPGENGRLKEGRIRADGNSFIKENSRDLRHLGATAAGAVYEMATIAKRLGSAGRMHEAVRRLNGLTDADLAQCGRTRSGEVDRIFD